MPEIFRESANENWPRCAAKALQRFVPLLLFQLHVDGVLCAGLDHDVPFWAGGPAAAFRSASTLEGAPPKLRLGGFSRYLPLTAQSGWIGYDMGCSRQQSAGMLPLMLQRFGFRTLAPALNLALFATLVVWGSSPRLIAYLQEVGVPFNPADNPLQSFLTTPRLIAIGLNAPAFLLSTLIVEVLPLAHTATAQSVLLLMCPFILLLWYLTGRWFDHRFGLLPAKAPTKKGRLLLVVTAILLGLVLAWTLYRVWYFLNGGIAGWHGETPIYAATEYGMAGWVALWEVMILMAIKQRSTNVYADAQTLASK